MVKKLILMVGLPRSGKSTRARILSKEQNAPIVSGDATRLALHGCRFLSEAEPMVHTLTLYQAKALFISGHDTVIVDECNVTKKRRERWENEFKHMCLIVYEHVTTTVAVCLLRAQEEKDTAIIPVIERMAAHFEPLTEE